MIRIKSSTEIEPIDLGTANGLDKNETYTRTVHFLGIRLWKFEDNRVVDIKNTKFATLNKVTTTDNSVGFKATSKK